ncbi:MAG TPA: hypothetical protein VER03_20100 [Bryobacteraceae bacterium]|nr:hypothetical protein [Bryobacteraceae bacterium]
MRRSYRRLLIWSRIQNDLASEMLDVFDQAAAEERGKGLIAYSRFCLREVGGAVMSIVPWGEFMTHRRMVAQWALAGAIIGGVAAGAWNARPHTSSAVLRVRPAQIPNHLVPTQDGSAVEAAVQNAVLGVTSTAKLNVLARSHGLFGANGPDNMERVAARMREAIQIEHGSVLRISFTHGDALVTPKVTADLVSLTIAEFARIRTTEANLSVEFMRESLKEAGAVLEQRLAAAHAAENARRPVQRLLLDTDIARQRYEMLSAKAWDAEMTSNLERRMQGPTLDLAVPPSKPERLRLSVVVALLGGAAGGILLGFIVSLALSAFRSRPVLQPA